ncbi:MAG: adenylate/guanylate cyclase domain-containing protein [Reyranellaceae bacterium]
MNGERLFRSLRLWSGVTLFVYVFSHLLNHTFGLISLAAMEAALTWFGAVWRSVPGAVVLYGALSLHLALVLWSLYRRRALRLPPTEAVQVAMGTLIVPLGVSHVIGTAAARAFAGVDPSYGYVLLSIWDGGWSEILRQFAFIVVVWVHGCIGLHQLWKLKPHYRRWRDLGFAVALLLPVLALVAFFQRGPEAMRLAAENADWLATLQARTNLPPAPIVAQFFAAMNWALFGYVLLLGGVFAARAGRDIVERRGALVRLGYPNQRRAQGPAGPSILEFSRLAGIPHASVCGGRGRCSTCRVRVGQGLELLAAASPAELRVLARIGAPDNVRLACQVHPPPGEYDVTPLLAAGARAQEALAQAAHHHGQEREIAVLFADIRGFTSLAEHRLPYDTVYVLNRYFRAVGEAIEAAGGHVDKFIGDGVMALFGLQGDPAAACRMALDAARRMALAIDALNESLTGDLPAPLRIGIGLHAGVAIVGELGYGSGRSLTAIGDSVNIASRLETMTKEFACELVVSDDLARLAQIDLSAWPPHEIAVRGRTTALVVRAIDDAALLPAGPPDKAKPLAAQ